MTTNTKTSTKDVTFHEAADQGIWRHPGGGTKTDTQFDYDFQSFFHPYVQELIQRLNIKSLEEMLDPVFLGHLNDPTFFSSSYDTSAAVTGVFPDGEQKSTVKPPTKTIELDGEPYANYNWELLFHFPLTIAVHLSKNQRFAEAQRWFHYIFDPTCNDVAVQAPKRYWKFLGFRRDVDPTSIGALLTLFSTANPTDEEKRQLDHLKKGLDAILKRPFQPHAVAQTRLIAYQYSVVMKYLDNQIAWGDSLFRQDTLESINEATQHYVLAANILGARPQQVPSPGSSRPLTFLDLKSQTLDDLGNAMVNLESQFPFNLGVPQAQGQGAGSGALFGIGRSLYFCVPRNEKMLAYWDTVADRLFKIRNSMNLEGVFRQLALFDPPIDPGMLVKAGAAGIDVGAIVSGLNQPISPVRSLLFVQKALELCSEVKALGGALLSAIEKGDAEKLALLRQSHEIKLQQMAQETRFLQWKQAQNATEALLKSRSSALERYNYYQRLLGLTPDASVAPDTLPLDRRELTEDNFDEAHSALVGRYDQAIPVQKLSALQIASSNDPGIMSGSSGAGQLNLNKNEDAELNTHMPTARDLHIASAVSDTLASVLVFIPDFNANLQFWGLGATSKVFGGSTVSEAAKIAGQILRLSAGWESDQAGLAGRTAGYERRADDWTLQSNLAARELMQLGKQILGSLIAEQVSHHEYLSTKKQIENSQEVNQLLHDKFSNQELYAWMQGEISRLYYEYYRFAFDTARKAEQSMKRELMRPEVDATDYVKFNYWDGGRKGLLSGEALYLDVKRMELAYHENNKREYELTKHVSLRQLDPAALLQLKASGKCTVTIPEWLYNMDCPSHYMRRIKTVSLSIPAVTGPYTGVNCTLSLLRSSLRKSPLGDYDRAGSDDDRFVDYVGATQSIVTSGGSNDSGLFETNLRDERILPFEGAGAESTWTLELPSDFRGFDYNTISDVVLHVRYTARDGGQPLGSKAVAQLQRVVDSADAAGLYLLLSLRNDLATEWGKYVSGGGGSDFKATIRRDYFPYFTAGRTITIPKTPVTGVELHAVQPDGKGGWKVKKQTLIALDADKLTNDLKQNGAFELSVPSGGALTPDPQSHVFLLIKYSAG